MADPVQRFCVCGTRTFQNLQQVKDAVGGLDAQAVVVHGGAEGVDKAAGEAAGARGLQVEVFPYIGELGRAGGPARNKKMIDTCDAVYAFWDGKSRGTKQAVRYALKQGKQVIVKGEDGFPVNVQDLLPRPRKKASKDARKGDDSRPERASAARRSAGKQQP